MHTPRAGGFPAHSWRVKSNAGVRLPINSAAQHGVQVKVHIAQHITTCRSEAVRAGSGLSTSQHHGQRQSERNGGVRMADPYSTLNELAQGLRPMSQGIEWFENLSAEEQSNTLRLLSHFCVQARATAEDGPESIRRAGLRATHTPAVLITRGRIDQQLGKIASLPARRAPQVVPAADRGAGRRRRTPTRAPLLRRLRPRVASPVCPYPRSLGLIPRAFAPTGPVAGGETSRSVSAVCASPRLRIARPTARRAAVRALTGSVCTKPWCRTPWPPIP